MSKTKTWRVPTKDGADEFVVEEDGDCQVTSVHCNGVQMKRSPRINVYRCRGDEMQAELAFCIHPKDGILVDYMGVHHGRPGLWP